MTEEYQRYTKLQEQIYAVKQIFPAELSAALGLMKVECPVLTRVGDGTQDNLSGFEKAVQVRVKEIPESSYEVVHSLAKWKRMTLGDHEFPVGRGIYADMRALRVEEVLDVVHSVYVDQWDWELVMRPEDRTLAFLQSTVNKIYGALRTTEHRISELYPELTPILPEKITYIHTEQLLQRYPELDPKSRERMVAKEFGAVFLIGIGGKLTNGDSHDARAPDYDDWSTPVQIDNKIIGFPSGTAANGEADATSHPSVNAITSMHGLNGDILVYNPVLNDVLELSSMGIRVDAETMHRQLQISGDIQRVQYGWHKRLLNNELPQTVGGGIGQSRLTMFLLRCMHIGNVQCSVWPLETHKQYKVAQEE